MQVIAQTVKFDDETSLQDTLAANGIGPQGMHSLLVGLLDAHVKVEVVVDGMPVRVLHRKSTVEKLVGHSLPGPDLLAIPFG